MRREWTHTGKKTYRAEKPHVYRVIILKQMADHRAPLGIDLDKEIRTKLCSEQELMFESSVREYVKS